AHPDSGRYYAHIQLVWDTSRSLAARSSVDEYEAWKRFLRRREDVGYASGRATKPLSGRMGGVRVAAVLVIGLLAAFGGYYLIDADQRGNRLSGGVPQAPEPGKPDTWADGPIIHLRN